MDAKALYEAFSSHPGHRFADGQPNQEWQDLAPERKQSWEHLAKVVASATVQQVADVMGSIVDEESLRASNRHVPHAKRKTAQAAHARH